MTNPRMLIAGLAILAAGATFGWNASRVADRADAESRAHEDTVAFDVTEPATGNLTPSKPYQPAPVKLARKASSPVRKANPSVRGITIPAGTPVSVTVDEALSSKTAQIGQSWSGVVAEPVHWNGHTVIPAGSRVRGTVALSEPAKRGDRARLQLAMSSITVKGSSYSVRGSSEAVVAGSPRARNVGAIAGGTAAGALIGKAVGGSTKSTVIGAVVGGAATSAVVAASRGYQATIPAGKELAFTTNSSMTVRA